jgi:transposase
MTDAETIQRLERRVSELEALVEKLVAENGRLRLRVEELEHRLRKNSSNSNRPPSSDPPGAPPPAPPKPPSGRSPGGQPGHPPHQRMQFPPEQVDRNVAVRPKACKKCHRELPESAEGTAWDSRQVVEMPPVNAEVWAFERHAVTCPGCGAFNLPDWPAEAAAFVGPRLQAFLALLVGRFRLSRREAQELLQEALGEKARICLGSVKNLESRTAEALETPYAQVLEAIRGESVVHVDETGWYERAKLVWLWVMATSAMVAYRIAAGRGRKAFAELVGGFDGVLVSDRWHVYMDWEPLWHQLCWSHAKRDFRKWEDRGGRSRRIGAEALECEAEVFALRKRREEGTLSRKGYEEGLRSVRRRLRRVLKRGTRVKPLQEICRRFLEQEESLWTFVRRRGVEPTNNTAERAARPPVMWRKICFGTWSQAGGRFAERMLTVVGTLRRQGRNALEFLTRAILAHRRGVRPPSPLPAQ